MAGNTSAYATSSGDSHATAAGNSKAAAEFPALLNVYYHCWAGTGDCPATLLRADFSAGAVSGYAPLAVDFTDLSSGSPTGWSWDFGDLGVSTQQHPSHTYAAPGTYTVSLTVADAGAGSSTETKVGYITVTPSPYAAAPSAGSIGTQIVVTGVDFGAMKGKLRLRYEDSRARTKRKSLRVLEWTDTRIVGEVKAKMEAVASDLLLQPRGLGEVVLTGAFTAMAPVVGTLTPSAGPPLQAVVVDGSYFGTATGKVSLQRLEAGRLKAHRCDVSSWTMDPTTGVSAITFTVDAGLAAGAYDVVVSSKIGATTVVGGFTVE
ncbi:MAG: PKD domain-containing protein [Deltaproteobacteria bacterium]|nr:PKD domain-containing protein [Deltaproteobacteria bacterium]